MMDKGFAVRENMRECSDDIKAPANPECYFPNTMSGRVAEWVRQVLRQLV